MARDPGQGINGELMNRFNAMKAAAAAAGFNISIGSGWRSVKEQEALRIQNGCPDVYSSPASSCRVPTAIPGTSNHNHGLAIDIDYGDNDEAAAWANAHGAEFGLHFPVGGENWHVEMIGGDADRHMQGAQGMGAIGYNLNWMDSPVSPEEKRDQLIQSYLGVMSSSQQEALLSTPDASAVDTPAVDPMVDTPDMAKSAQVEDVPSVLRQETTSIEGAPGQAPTAGGPAAEGDRLGNARIIAQVGRSMGMDDHAIKIALAAALVESNLVNVNYGDRDSLGLFQQRPSQGWGTPDQVRNPQYAARKFFEGLMGKDLSDPGAAAQAVQRSAFPGRYNERWGEANSIFGQL